MAGIALLKDCQIGQRFEAPRPIMPPLGDERLILKLTSLDLIAGIATFDLSFFGVHAGKATVVEDDDKNLIWTIED